MPIHNDQICIGLADHRSRAMQIEEAHKLRVLTIQLSYYENVHKLQMMTQQKLAAEQSAITTFMMIHNRQLSTMTKELHTPPKPVDEFAKTQHCESHSQTSEQSDMTFLPSCLLD
jgi:hypothetical protein